MVPGAAGAAGAPAGQTAGLAGAGAVTTPVHCLEGRNVRGTPQRSPPPPATVTTVVQVSLQVSFSCHVDVLIRHLRLPWLLQEVRRGRQKAEILPEHTDPLPVCGLLRLAQLLPGRSQLRVNIVTASHPLLHGGGRYYCYCGEEPGDQYQEEDCDKVCDGDQNSNCGGYVSTNPLNSLYGTGQ